ncbi:hypothetical protein AB0N20_32010 [Streptomyces griseoincarnatus]
MVGVPELQVVLVHLGAVGAQRVTVAHDVPTAAALRAGAPVVRRDGQQVGEVAQRVVAAVLRGAAGVLVAVVRAGHDAALRDHRLVIVVFGVVRVRAEVHPVDVVADRVALIVPVVRVIGGLAVIAAIGPRVFVGVGVVVLVGGVLAVAQAAVLVAVAPLVLVADLALALGRRRAVGARDHGEPGGVDGGPLAGGHVLHQHVPAAEGAQDTRHAAAPEPRDAARLDEPALAVAGVQVRVPRAAQPLGFEAGDDEVCGARDRHAADHAHRRWLTSRAACDGGVLQAVPGVTHIFITLGTDG